MEHFDLPSSELLNAVIDKLSYMKMLYEPDGKLNEEKYYKKGITPVSLTNRDVNSYNVARTDDGYHIERKKVYNKEGLLGTDKMTGEMMHDLGQYYVNEASQEMFNTFYNPNYDTGISNEFNQLFSVILPKLIVIRKMNTLAAQKDSLEGYGYKHDDIKQYLANLLHETEASIRKYLGKGQFFHPLDGNKAVLRYALK